MKKPLFLLLAAILAGTLILVGCGTKATTTAPTTTAPAVTTAPKPTTTAPAATTAPLTTTAAPTTAASAHPVQGSIVRIMNQGPTVLGYPPEMGPNDNYSAVYALEPLFILNETGVFEPVLAESWNIDAKAMTIVLHIRKGVSFTDGTPCDANAIKWNCQLLKDAKIQYFTYINSMDVIDANTLRLNLSSYDITTIQMMSSYSMISPTAYQNGGTTDDARKVWARANPVGTGPYKLVEYKRDSYISFTRNPNYWRTGKPYIQNVKILIIPDIMVSSALLQSGDADVWWSNANIAPTAIDLEKKGFGVNWGNGSISYMILFNSADKSKPWSDARVRQAVEYAINRPELASLVGYGKYIPLKMLAAPGSYGDDGTDPHAFNVQTAKNLLTQAGYPNGFSTTLLTIARDTATAQAVQAYLKTVNINVTLDMSDTARYYNMIWTTTGWPDITLVMMPLAVNSSEIIWQMGSHPLNFKAACFYKSPEFLALSDKALTYATYEDAKTIMQQMVKMNSDQAFDVPLFEIPYSIIYYKNYHTEYCTPQGGSQIWRVYNDWTDKTK